MLNFMTPAEVALATRRHVETVTLALRDGELCGSHSKRNGRWLIEEPCALAWIRGEECGHPKREKQAKRVKAAA